MTSRNFRRGSVVWVATVGESTAFTGLPLPVRWPIFRPTRGWRATVSARPRQPTNWRVWGRNPGSAPESPWFASQPIWPRSRADNHGSFLGISPGGPPWPTHVSDESVPPIPWRPLSSQMSARRLVPPTSSMPIPTSVSSRCPTSDWWRISMRFPPTPVWGDETWPLESRQP